MKTNIRIALRYSILISLLMLLWLALEYMVGLQDTFAAWHPVVTWFSLIIPIVCLNLALKEKRSIQNGGLNFRQAFLTAFMVVLFATVLAIPVQLIFNTLVNPDFFQSMIDYSIRMALAANKNIEAARSQAESYFNLTSYLIQSVLETFVLGTAIALFSAWRVSR